MKPEALLQFAIETRNYALMESVARQVQGLRKFVGSLHPLVFGRVYFPELFRYKTPEFHWEISDDWLNLPLVAISAPVGSAKTTVTTICGNLFAMFHEDQTEEAMIIGASGELVGVWLDKMGNMCKRNRALYEDFGDFVGQKWGSATLEFNFPRRRKFITGLGKGAAIRGRRPDRMTIDDPEDEHSLKSKVQREDFRDWFWGAARNRLDDPSKHLAYIATCVDPEAFIVDLINNPPHGWITKNYAMLDEEKNISLWPDKYPVENLAERRLEIGEEKFQQEFQNNPIRLYRRKLFDKYPEEHREPQPGADVYITCDPAFVKGRDAWAIAVSEIDDHRHIHVREVYKENSGMRPMMEKLLELRKRFTKVRAFGIETSATQESLVWSIEELERRESVHFGMIYIKHSRSDGPKTARLAVLSRVVNDGSLTYEPGLVEMRKESEAYVVGKEKQEDHLLDAVHMILEVSDARKPKVEPEKMTEQERIHERYWDITAPMRRQAPTKTRGRFRGVYGEA